MESGRILIVDDEAGVRDLLADALKMAGFETIVASDGLTALTLQRKHEPELMIIDINMPKMDGFELVERLRSSGVDTPVLMLSARGDKTDVTKGLRIGADDYVKKPFGLEELVLRINAILRRTRSSIKPDEILHCGPISLDEAKHEVRFQDELIDLSPTEFKLLHFLMLRPGRVISKETLLSSVWDIDFESNSTVVDTYISYLRKKLHREGFEGIRTVRGVGFQLVIPK